MKRLISAPIVVVLLMVLIFTSSCDFTKSPDLDVVKCMGNVVVKVVTSIMSEDVPLTVVALLSVVPDCVTAAVAEFSSPANAASSTPEVDINESSQDSVATGSVNSNTWSNCTDSPQTARFDFTVPFTIIVGQAPNQKEFTASPSGSSDEELIGNQLFQKYGSYIASITSQGPSQSEMLTIPPQTKLTLTLPIQVSYKTGEARVVHTDGSTVSLPWLFTDGYQQTGPVTSTTASC